MSEMQLQPQQWQRVDGVGELNKDFRGHFAYFCQWRLLSFIWDGQAEYITVAHGGYGEPVEWVIPAIVTRGTPAQCLLAFRDHCRASLREWDERFAHEEDFGYHDVHLHCAAKEESYYPPSGSLIRGRYREPDWIMP